jgi:hypothetical protein
MTPRLIRRLENLYIASYIEVTEADIEIPFDRTWISYLSSKKKIRIRRIDADVDPETDSPFNHQIGYSTQQGNSIIFKIFILT